MRQNTSPKGVKGIGIVRAILLIPLLLIVALIAWVIFAEARKSYWDDKVREMCAKDGGIHVSETVVLDSMEYKLLINKFGKLEIPSREKSLANTPLVYIDQYSYIRDWNPGVWRYELKVIRPSDQKVLGTRVSYARVGGDSFTLHPSSFGCPEMSGDLFSAVVRKKEIEK